MWAFLSFLVVVVGVSKLSLTPHDQKKKADIRDEDHVNTAETTMTAKQ